MSWPLPNHATELLSGCFCRLPSIIVRWVTVMMGPRATDDKSSLYPHSLFRSPMTNCGCPSFL